MALYSTDYAGNTAYLVANIDVSIGMLDDHRSASSGMIFLDGNEYVFCDPRRAGLVAVHDHRDLLQRDEISERALWDHQFTNIAV